MTESELIHRLFYLAMIDIRVKAHETRDTKIFYLADLFHNIPLQLEKAIEGGQSYEEILSWIRTHAELKGCKDWLDWAIEEAAKTDSKGKEIE